MIVHLIVTFGKNADNSPLAQALRANNIDLVVFSSSISISYRKRIALYLIGWPKLLVFSIKTAIKSLNTKEQPDIVVLNSHFDCLANYIICRLLFKNPPKLVLPGFIYTQHSNRLIQNIKYKYYKWIMKHSDLVICHSENESSQNQELFGETGAKFSFFPYAMHVNGATGYSSDTLASNKLITAGRSERDYETFTAALKSVNYTASIICDYFPSINAKNLPGNVKVLTNCYGDCYFKELISCRIVVIPLLSLDISAGQMVAIQAMSFGKPVIMTRTKTSVHYVQHMKTGVLVEPGDAEGLTSAIKLLMSDNDLCELLGKQAAEEYQRNFSIEAYARQMLTSISEITHTN